MRSDAKASSAGSTSIRLAAGLGACLLALLWSASIAAADACPNEALRVGIAAGLPDCRAYEQSSPVDKGGANVSGTPGLVQVASSGDGITWFSQGGVPGAGGEGAQDFPSYLSTRRADAWSSQGLLAPQAFGRRSNVDGYTEDLGYAVVEAWETGHPRTLYLKDTETKQFEVIVPLDLSPELGGFTFVGADEGDTLFFFESTRPLTQQAPGEQLNLYVWDRSTGDIRLVSKLPAGEGGGTAAEGSFAGPYDWEENATSSGGRFAGRLYISAIGALSSTGDRAYFTAVGSGQLYLRQGLTTAQPETIHISATQKTNGTDPNAPQPAALLGASKDGSKVFFSSSEQLTNNANTGPADQGKDLYLFDAETEQLTDLTPDPTGNGAEVQGLLGNSGDGSSAYFAAKGSLAAGAVAGELNIYRYEETGSGPSLTFVAALEEAPLNGSRTVPHDEQNWSARGGKSTAARTARVSSDGEILLFRSQEALTGYDNLAPNCLNKRGSGANSGALEPCPELYRYDAETEQIDCVSCDPDGAAPQLFAQLESNVANALYETADTRGGVMHRNLSEDGNRIFFETPDSLVPADTNGAGCEPEFVNQLNAMSCQDVYEWEATGTGSCIAPNASGGCLYLLSSGRSPTATYFADADRSGENVYLITYSQLVGQDRDSLADLYDVAIGGGLASQNPPPSVPCVAEACLGAAGLAPAAQTAGSETFSGPPNQRPSKPRCAAHKKCKAKHHKRHRKPPHKRHKDGRSTNQDKADQGGAGR